MALALTSGTAVRRCGAVAELSQLARSTRHPAGRSRVFNAENRCSQIFSPKKVSPAPREARTRDKRYKPDVQTVAGSRFAADAGRSPALQQGHHDLYRLSGAW